MADALSRVVINRVFHDLPAVIAQVGSSIDLTTLARAQSSDQDIAHLRHDPTHGLRLQDVRLVNDILLCDTSTGRSRPVVPASWRCRVFDTLHGLSHPSVRVTRQLITRRFVWRQPPLLTFPHGRESVTSVKLLRFTDTCRRQLLTFLHHLNDFSMFISTSSAPYRCPIATHTS